MTGNVISTRISWLPRYRVFARIFYLDAPRNRRANLRNYLFAFFTPCHTDVSFDLKNGAPWWSRQLAPVNTLLAFSRVLFSTLHGGRTYFPRSLYQIVIFLKSNVRFVTKRDAMSLLSLSPRFNLLQRKNLSSTRFNFVSVINRNRSVERSKNHAAYMSLAKIRFHRVTI